MLAVGTIYFRKQISSYCTISFFKHVFFLQTKSKRECFVWATRSSEVSGIKDQEDRGHVVKPDVIRNSWGGSWHWVSNTHKQCRSEMQNHSCIKYWYFFYFSTKTYVVGIHWNCLNKALLMSTHKICFRGEIRQKYLSGYSLQRNCLQGVFGDNYRIIFYGYS